jgi:hypothetical protein
MTPGDFSSFDVELLLPRLVKNAHHARSNGGFVTTSSSTWTESAVTTVTKYFATAQKVLKVRAVVGTLASLDAGKVYLFRRREYASLA